MQKQTNLPNSLLQDIAVLNEHDSTRLEEWLTDIETVADLTNESRAKLAKATLRGFTHTLVIVVINLGKSRDEIKNLLWLKLCNTDIHTYTSHFMESSSEKRNPLQHTSIGSRWKLTDATL